MDGPSEGAADPASVDEVGAGGGGTGGWSGMAELEVDTEALVELAGRIRAAAAEARAATGDPGPLRATVASLAEAELIRAAELFVDRWEYAMHEVIADAQRLADAVDLAARSYLDAESVARRAASPITGGGVGNDHDVGAGG